MYFYWYPKLGLCWRDIFDWACTFPLLLVAIIYIINWGMQQLAWDHADWKTASGRWIRCRENMQLASGSVTGHQQVFVSTGVINSQHDPRAKDGTNHFFPLLATTGIIWDCMPLEKDSTAKPGCAMMNLYIIHALMYRYNQITSAWIFWAWTSYSL